MCLTAISSHVWFYAHHVLWLMLASTAQQNIVCVLLCIFLCIYWKITGRSQALWARVLSCFICCHVATCNIEINCMRGPEECWDPGGTCCLLAWSMRQVFARFNFHELSSGLFQLRFIFEKPAAPGLSQRRLGRRATPKYGACTKLLFDTPLRPHEQRDRRLQQQR
jgi:hypothetical protein